MFVWVTRQLLTLTLFGFWASADAAVKSIDDFSVEFQSDLRLLLLPDKKVLGLPNPRICFVCSTIVSLIWSRDFLAKLLLACA
jgi:hypothetical protein